jgi:hypothetical protein
MNKLTAAEISKWLFVALAIFGVAGVAPIALRQWTGDASCPSLGFVPACYVALLGYSLVAVSAFLKDRVRLLVFLFGFVPIFALAAAGSGLEFLGQMACPRSDGGTPMCFYSLALAFSLAVLYLIDQRS